MKKNRRTPVSARLARRRRANRPCRGLSLERLDERLTLSAAPPDAFNDAYAVIQDAPLNVAASGVMANDSDADGDALTAELFSGPSHGLLTFQSDGGFSYEPAAGFTGLDSFVYRVNDGTSYSKFAAVTLRVELPTFAPALDLDADDSSAAGAAFAAVFTEDQAAVSVADADAALSDADSENLASLSVKIMNPLDGAAESLAADVSGTGITAAYDSASGTLSLTGSDTPANYLQVLKTVTYSNASQNPNLTPRVVSFTANDGAIDSNTAVATVTIVGANDAPVTADDAYETNEDQTLVVAATGVLTNDADADGDALSAVLVAGPAHGTLAMNDDGSFSYTPEADYFGDDSFTYRADDGQEEGPLASVTISVGSVNDAPSAVNDSYAIDEDQPLVVAAAGVLGNDGDFEGAPLTAVQVSGPMHGSLTFNADGSFSYVPEANFFGVDGFSYVANDGAADSDVATVTIEVAAVNDAPTSLDDAYEIAEDAVLDVSAAGVLANDADVEGDALSAVLVAGPSHGALTLNADGSFSYAPEANYHGLDSFTYRANDGTEDGAVATVALTVTSVNDVPVAVNDAYAGVEDEPLAVDAAGGVMANDLDGDGDSLVASLAAGPTHGTVTLNADGSFIYVPEANFFGVDAFSYVVNDGTADSDVATVQIETAPANDVPVANNDEYAMDEDGELAITAPGLLANDADVESDSLAVVVPVTAPSHGTLVANADGSFTYAPEANFHGVDAFSYQISDGQTTSSVAAVTITINAVNDAPAGVEDSYNALEGETLVVAAAGVLANDADVDGDALSALLENGPSHEALTLNADGSFSYVPESNFSGVDSFTYRASDGTESSGVTAVLINVVSTNDPAVDVNDRYSVGEDNPLVVPADLGVLANDFDPDFDSLTATVLTQPAHGTLAFNADGSFTYVPEANFFGVDTFTYLSNDGEEDGNSATVKVKVNAVNDAPVANAESYTVLPGATLTVDAAGGVLANDADIENSPLEASLLFGPFHGAMTFQADGSFVYAPEAGYAGDDGFWYQAYDGEADSNVRYVTLSVAGTSVENAPPVSAADAYVVDEDQTLDATDGVLANDTDAEGDSLTAVLVTPPQHGQLTFQADGTFQYVPETNFNGSDTFAYVANDGTADGNTVSVTIEVASVNDAPKSQNEVFSVVEGQTLDVPAGEGVLANDSDVDGTPLTAVLVTPPQHGEVTLQADGSFSYEPAAGFNGTDSFSYAADDGEEQSDVATATIEVVPVNDPPTADNDSYRMSKGETLSRDAAGGVLMNDVDDDGDTLTAVLFSQAAHGTVTLGTDGSFSYEPEAGFAGTDSFTYRANDGTSSSFVAAVTVRILDPNMRLTAPAPCAPTAFNFLASSLCDVQFAMCDMPGEKQESEVDDVELGRTTLDLNGAVRDALFTPVVAATGAPSSEDLDFATDDLWTCELLPALEGAVRPEALDEAFSDEKSLV